MFTQTKWNVNDTLITPDGGEDVVIGVRVTNLRGKHEEAYLLEHGFVWWSLQELMEINNGK